MQEHEHEFSFKDLFVPFTTLKAIHWIIFIGLVVFANMLFNGFVWDDKTYILNNFSVHSINIFQSFKESTFNTGGQYRPIPAIYFSILYFLFGNYQLYYHLFQIVIHIVNSILIFLLFKKFLDERLAFIASLIFLVHPMQVESVSYIASSDNPLFVLFGLVALFLSMQKNVTFKRMFFISGLLLLSLLTKETGGLFILVILVYRYIFEKKDFIYFVVSEIGTIVIYFLIRFLIGGVFFLKIAAAPIDRLTLLERVINIPSVVFYYIKSFILPINLSIDQQWIITKVNLQSFYFPLLIIFLILAFACLLCSYLWNTNKKNLATFVFFFLWSLLGMLMYMQLYPIDETVADRWFYFPIIGYLGVLAVMFQTGILLPKRFEKLIYVLLAVSIVVLSARTIARNNDWNNAINLYSHDASIYDNFELEQNLALEYIGIQNYPEALKHFTKSVNLFPNEANLSALGNTYVLLGDPQKSLDFYNNALSSNIYLPIGHKHLLVTYINFGELLLLTENIEKAKVIINHGLLDYPNSFQLWCELALVENKLFHHNEALHAAEKAKMIFPSNGTEYLYSQILNNQQIQLTQNSGIIGWINQSLSNSVVLSK